MHEVHNEMTEVRLLSPYLMHQQRKPKFIHKRRHYASVHRFQLMLCGGRIEGIVIAVPSVMLLID